LSVGVLLRVELRWPGVVGELASLVPFSNCTDLGDFEGVLALGEAEEEEEEEEGESGE
jgi:hypothetical protein